MGFSEVRKAILVNIETSPFSLPHILLRARDVDPHVRKICYLKILEDVPDLGVFTIEERDRLLANGLSDR